jgi:hypothetical protein
MNEASNLGVLLVVVGGRLRRVGNVVERRIG